MGQKPVPFERNGKRNACLFDTDCGRYIQAGETHWPAGDHSGHRILVQGAVRVAGGGGVTWLYN